MSHPSMTKFFNLTGAKGSSVYINAQKVTAIHPVKDAYSGNTVVHLAGGELIRVEETADEVLKIISDL